MLCETQYGNNYRKDTFWRKKALFMEFKGPDGSFIHDNLGIKTKTIRFIREKFDGSAKNVFPIVKG